MDNYGTKGLRFLLDRSASGEKAVLKTGQESFLLLEEADCCSALVVVILLFLHFFLLLWHDRFP